MEKTKSFILLRDHSIDLLETIAIILVLISHGTCYSYNFLASESFVNYARYFFRSIIPVSIPIFFFVNGYLLLNKPFNLKRHIKRIIRLVILTTIWGIITVVCYMFILGKHLTLAEILLKVWRFEEEWTNHLWFMGTLICLYIFFPLLKLSWDKDKNIFLFFTIITFVMTIGNVMLNEGLTAFSTLVLNKTYSYSGLNFFNKYNPFRFIRGYYSIAYFCIGGYAYLYRDKICKISAAKRNILAGIMLFISSLCLTVINVIYSQNNEEIRDIVWQGFDSIFTCINLVCIWILCLNFKKDSPLIKNVSCNTLGIYFIHPIIIKATIGYVFQIPALCSVWFNIIYALITLSLCLIIIFLIKKIPLVKKLLV